MIGGRVGKHGPDEVELAKLEDIPWYTSPARGGGGAWHL